MSYLALARKWRPHKFHQVVGQSHVLTALENALSQNRLHHAYLFSGTRGVGKTTIGRLFAKGLNCETGITANPCGECSTCREIDEGRFVDLLEIDAASRTKVEDTRELLDNVQYKPARGRFKVYLIDEVHMLSRHSFNALLKTLEEPPEYVKFLLATTDPQKLPVTILSRCLQFHLKPISVDDIHQQLDVILAKESVSSEPRALGMISHAADGSMRDALSLTDQAIALGNGNILTDTVVQMLGTLDVDQAVHLIDAIADKRAQSTMDMVETFAQNGVDWDGLLQELATQLHRVAMYQALPSTLDRNAPDAERIELISQKLTPQDVQLYYQIALKGREDMPNSPNARIGIEMTLLRMLAFRPVKVNGAEAISINVDESESSTSPASNVPLKQAVSSITPSEPTTTQRAPSVLNKATVERQAPAVSEPQISPQKELEPRPNESNIRSHGSGHSSERQEVEQQPNLSSSHSVEVTQTSAPSSFVEEDEQSEQNISGAMSAYDEYANMQQVQPVESNSQPDAASPAPNTPAAPKRSAAGLRHQLRSQRKGITQNRDQGTSVKKAQTASDKPQSVIERVVMHANRGQVSPNHSESSDSTNIENKVQPSEPYQWKASKPEVKQEKSELTPSQIKRALEHVKTPEMADKLHLESIEQDEWAALINRLSTAKLVQQLALNSCYKKSGNVIELELRQSQSHLNTDKAQSELLQALNQELGEECHLSVTIGEGGQTPLELRDSLYQGKLEQAFDSLQNDPNIQFIEQRFMAELDNESVRPI